MQTFVCLHAAVAGASHLITTSDHDGGRIVIQLRFFFVKFLATSEGTFKCFYVREQCIALKRAPLWISNEIGTLRTALVSNTTWHSWYKDSRQNRIQAEKRDFILISVISVLCI